MNYQVFIWGAELNMCTNSFPTEAGAVLAALVHIAEAYKIRVQIEQTEQGQIIEARHVKS